MFEDEWGNIHLNRTYRRMLLKRIDKHNDLLEQHNRGNDRFHIMHERTIMDNENGIGFVCSYKTDAEELCKILNNLNNNLIICRQENQRLKK